MFSKKRTIRTVFFGFLPCIFVLALFSSTSLAFEFKFKVNGKEVDLFKKSDEKKEQKQKQVSGSKKSSKKSAKKSSKNSVTARVAGKGPMGPDVIGLRIGTEPSDVRAIFQKRSSLAPKEEFKYILKGVSRDGKFKAHMKEKSLQSLSLYVNRSAQDTDDIVVFFTPNPPGNEKVMAISRTVVLKDKPTVSAFEGSIIKKYGTPTYSSTKYKRSKTYGWIYDSNGVLQKPGLYKLMDYLNKCGVGSIGKGPVQGYHGGADVAVSKIYEYSMKRTQMIHNSVSPVCSSISLRIGVNTDYNLMVRLYTTNVQGYDEFFGSSLAAKARGDQNAEIVYKQAVKKGETVKPDL